MKKSVILIFLITILSVSLSAQKIPDLKGYVNDYAGVLSSSEESQMVQMLSSLERSTSAQIAVLTVQDLQGYNVESFSLKTAEEWSLGQKDRDNGILVLLAMNEKEVRIEVGYGLEGEITDIKSGYIIRNIILPEFRKGNFGKGLYDGISAINGIITETSDISESELKTYVNEPEKRNAIGIPLNMIIFIIIFIFSSLLRGRRRGRGGFFNAILLGSILGGSNRRGGGGFGGGGFGGGGFSGGGGGFGGGGASGGW